MVLSNSSSISSRRFLANSPFLREASWNSASCCLQILDCSAAISRSGAPCVALHVDPIVLFVAASSLTCPCSRSTRFQNSERDFCFHSSWSRSMRCSSAAAFLASSSAHATPKVAIRASTMACRFRYSAFAAASRAMDRFAASATAKRVSSASAARLASRSRATVSKFARASCALFSAPCFFVSSTRSLCAFSTSKVFKRSSCSFLRACSSTSFFCRSLSASAAADLRCSSFNNSLAFASAACCWAKSSAFFWTT
mmetsp:Transcript_61557/g.177156  ORF Transcript_61557/g.177156 Transcript_61557/m.177156 type:complete len:255 (-) Transcript_61557:458-1222(-)